MTKEEYKAKESKRRFDKLRDIQEIKRENNYWLFDNFSERQFLLIKFQKTDLIKIKCIDDRDFIGLEFGKIYEIPAFCFQLREQLIWFEDGFSYPFGRFELVKDIEIEIITDGRLCPAVKKIS